MGPFSIVNRNTGLACAVNDSACANQTGLTLANDDPTSMTQQFYLGQHGSIFSAKCRGLVIEATEFTSPPRKVKLQHDSSSTEVLNIGEVEVYDQSGTNQALNKTATQSSSHHIGPAYKAVDGDDNTFSHTLNDSGKLMLETKLF